MAKKNYVPLSQAESGTLEAQPVFNLGVQLLGSTIQVLNGEGDMLELEIHEMEAFTGLLKNLHIEPFDSKTRNRGDVFLTWFRGHMQLNIVEDPDAKSVVCVTEVSVGGEKASINAILKHLDFTKSTIPDNAARRQAVGLVLDGEPALAERETATLKIILATREAAAKRVGRLPEYTGPDNSLGRYGLVVES